MPNESIDDVMDRLTEQNLLIEGWRKSNLDAFREILELCTNPGMEDFTRGQAERMIADICVAQLGG